MEHFKPKPYKPGESKMAHRMYMHGLVQRGIIPPPPREVKKRYFFFYGTLCLPHVLREVLKLDKDPEYRNATVRGFAIKMWSTYPALVPSETRPFVNLEGKAWFGDENDLERLREYEGDKYHSRNVSILLEGDTFPVVAWAFAWNGDPEELEDGTFDPSHFMEPHGEPSL
ncbi:hypothetical protein AX16_010797 [Volvariella volvacea WC 439]|nr:hypothetical protein AX16_010797 [Volvariella volvacea WC 439]